MRVQPLSLLWMAIWAISLASAFSVTLGAFPGSAAADPCYNRVCR